MKGWNEKLKRVVRLENPLVARLCAKGPVVLKSALQSTTDCRSHIIVTPGREFKLISVQCQTVVLMHVVVA